MERERLQDRLVLLGYVPHVQGRSVLVRCHVFLNQSCLFFSPREFL
jgi:hypothetical protein